MRPMAGLPTPERVARFQEAYAAPTRAYVLRVLLQQSRTYPELFALISEETMSRSSVYEALRDLTRFGYVEDDAPEGAVRKPKRTKIWACRELIAEDLGATVAWLLG